MSVRGDSPLLTDLYQFSMVQAYLAEGMTAAAVFELSVRRLPPQRRFLVAAGLEPALQWLQGLQFTSGELDWLAAQPEIGGRLLAWLRALRFDGDVDAVPEGTVVFAHEPLLRVTAPLPLAQWVESRLLNIVHLHTLLASKAARCVLAADGRGLLDFGLRRAHGGEAAMAAARSAWIAGFQGSSNVAAAMALGMPCGGTMAHSYVLAHDTERAAFEAFARCHPHGCVLLLDTYDTERAARRLTELAPALRAAGAELAGVRLDSGELGTLARRVRTILDGSGLGDVRILASGGLDEHHIAALVAAGAPIDRFGVGTALVTSDDVPALDAAYKLQAYDGRPCRKRSAGKANWPGAKQVYRRLDRHGRISMDRLVRADEHAAGEALLQPVMRGGERLREAESLDAIRERCRRQLGTLPLASRALEASDGEACPLRISAALRALAARLDDEVR